MEPGIDVGMDSLLAEVALRSGLLATWDSSKAERYHLLDKFNRFKIKRTVKEISIGEGCRKDGHVNMCR